MHDSAVLSKNLRQTSQIARSRNLESRITQDWNLLADFVAGAYVEHRIFTRDYEFDSPSAAAGIIRGENAKGLTEWRNADGKTRKVIEGLA